MELLEHFRSSRVYRAVRGLRYLVPSRPRPVILMYHRIAHETFDPWGLAVTPANFAHQLDWLSGNRTVLPLTEFAKLHRRNELPEDAIAMTLDDGYACNARFAVPLLNKLKIPATIFVSVDVIELGGSFWWHDLEQIVLGATGTSIEFNGMTVQLGPSDPGDREWRPGAPPRTRRQAAFLRLWRNLRAMRPEQLREVMVELRSGTGLSPANDLKRPMTAAEVRSVASDLIEIGSHALTHSPLPQLSRWEKTIEIRESGERCGALVGRRPRAFAYPYGDFDLESEKLVAEAGFDCACTTEHRSAGPTSRAFALPRLAVSNAGSGVLRRVLRTVPA